MIFSWWPPLLMKHAILIWHGSEVGRSSCRWHVICHILQNIKSEPIFGWHLCSKTGIPPCEKAECHSDRWGGMQACQQTSVCIKGSHFSPGMLKYRYMQSFCIWGTRVSWQRPKFLLNILAQYVRKLSEFSWLS